MFERVSQVAEALATGMSRRGFLGSFGRWAGATALAMAGVLTTAGTARAGGKYTCCKYYGYLDGYFYCGSACVANGTPCPPPSGGCSSTTIITVENCNKCSG
jgi:hypothetical protein